VDSTKRSREAEKREEKKREGREEKRI